MADCENCKYAAWDFEEYFPVGEQYFVSGCMLGNDEDDCQDFALPPEPEGW